MLTHYTKLLRDPVRMKKVSRTCSAAHQFYFSSAGPSHIDTRSTLKDGPTRSEQEIDLLFNNNKLWASKLSKEYRDQMARKQKPTYLWVGCSDSRVPAETVLGLKPGEVFVHRNVGNLVANQDVNFHSVLHYAVGVLKIRHILVCGHYDCGAVIAALSNTDHGFVDHWLRNIRDIQRIYQAELSAITDKDARVRRLVELNIAEQCLNIFKTAVVQKARAESVATEGEPIPRIHPMVFDPATGHITKINVDWDKFSGLIKDVYQFEDIP